MLLGTERGTVDLEKIVFLDTFKGNCNLNTDELQISLSSPEDRMLAQYFFTNVLITGDSILELAKSIQHIRCQKEKPE